MFTVKPIPHPHIFYICLMVCCCIPFFCCCCCMKPSTGVCFTQLPFLLFFLVHYAFFASRFSDSSSTLFQVLVWHTRTEKPHLANEPKHRKDTVVIEVWSGLPVISWLRLPAALCFPLPFGLIQSAGDGQSLWGAAWFKTPCCLSNIALWELESTKYLLQTGTTWTVHFLTSTACWCKK